MSEPSISYFNGSGRMGRDYVLLSCFFLLLPFVYALQVVSGSPRAGIIGYVPLVLALVGVILNWEACLRQFLTRQQLLGALVFALVIHNMVSALDALAVGDVGLGGRVLFLFVLAIVVFVVGGRLSSEQHWGIANVIVLTTALVAAELLWEDISIWLLRESSWFQLKNRYYVLGQTGKDLGQLWWTEYRPTGLLEHVHVSTFYLVVGVVAGIAVYLKTAAKRYLAAAVFCEVVLVAHGVRFALLVGVTATMLFLALVHWYGLAERRDRLRHVVLWLVLAALLVLSMDPFGTVHRFYIPAFTQGVWDPDRPKDSTVETVVTKGLETAVSVLGSRLGAKTWSWDFFNGLFGHGVASSLSGKVDGLDDDFFVTQVFSQYGLVGGTAFYLMFAAALRQGVSSIRWAPGANGLLLAFALTVIFVLVVSTLHSGVIQRKVMFALLLWVLAIVHFHSISRFQGENVK